MKIRKNGRLSALVLAAAIVFTGVPGSTIDSANATAASKVTLKLNKTNVSVEEGKKVTLKLVKKNVKKVKSIQWSSKNKKTASVNSKGKVTGKKGGKSTTVICKVKYIAKGSNKVSSKNLNCKVKVIKKDTSLEQEDQNPVDEITQAEKSDAIVPTILAENRVQQNPYLSDKEAMIHNDIYSSDVTANAMPLGIYPEVIEMTATDSLIAPPAFFYDNYGNAIAPYTQVMEDGSTLAGGIAIRDMDSPEIDVKGKFQPYLHDNGAKYGIQISYAFVDKDNYLIGPTTHGHVLMINTYNDKGEILPVFEKKLDVDVVTGAVKALGDNIDKNVLSVTYDYSGNLWFITGGFHKNPVQSKPGFVGYLERAYIDRALAGENGLDAEKYLHYKTLKDGENAENGISANKEGCVIETNLTCYLFRAGSAQIETIWDYDYKSSGGKKARPEMGITGTGLAWGGGSTPTLTDDMVLFTDNQDVVNLIALDIKTGKELACVPVLDFDSDVTVSVDNSICVYDAGAGKTSVLICNWFGAGNAGLFEEGADSSIQTFDNIYDKNWREHGSSSLMPGIERVDIVEQKDGSYKAEKIWLREDLKDTSMIKLSTAAGCYYGYTQLEETSEWGFIALDYETGKTILWQPVSTEKQYNNAAVGIMQGNNGNTIYCPTDSQVLVRLQDRFAYLPDQPDKKLDIVKMERHVISEDDFAKASRSDQAPAGYLLSAVIDHAAASQKLAFRMNGLDGTISDYTVYYKDLNGNLKQVLNPEFTDSTGRAVEENEELLKEAIYEVRLMAEDSSQADLDKTAGIIKTTIILATEGAKKEKTPQQLFDLAVKDSVFAEEDEIHPLVTLTKEDPLVTWDDKGRVLMCTWHNYPDSYPAGKKVTINWGYVWTFTDKEIATHAEELNGASDPELRFNQLIAFAPEAKHSTVTGFWVNPSDVRRPAYQSDPTKGTMTTGFADTETTDQGFKEWFDQNILSSYFYGSYPWTRLGYTYDWADNGKEYGMTEFIVNPGSEVEVAFTETTDEFLKRIFNMN